ncbi:MAG: type II toxin-antitoxin system VapC family toxin [Gammaproteobacteria bacterium]|nr:type II toxin-antitoxin system VapC family toxin [Gammaproteobacteria bacterium]
MVLVDTNVLLDLFTDDRTWRRWSENAMRDALVDDTVAVNPIIYAEASIGFPESRVLDRHLDDLTVQRLPLPYAAAFPAGRAFLRYRRAGGQRSAPLPDFFIGAHAQAQDLTLLTRDPNRYRTYFPNVRLIAPSES